MVIIPYEARPLVPKLPPYGQWVFDKSLKLPPVGQWVCDKSRDKQFITYSLRVENFSYYE